MIAIDVGNTTLHFAWLNSRGKVARVKKLSTVGVEMADIKEILSASKRETIVVCSVVPDVTALFYRLKKIFNPNIYIVGEDIKVPIKSFYNKRRIGMDRLVAAYAAKKIYKEARMIIDFGTAITFDVLSENGSYEGGLILPGLGSTLRVLSSCALLPDKIKLHKSSVCIPRDTKDSINRGITEGFSLMLDALIEKYKKLLKLNKNAKAIITGGDAELIVRNLKSSIIFDQFLVIKGIKLLAAEFIS